MQVPIARTLTLIAHRGGVVDQDRSENSLKALEEAIRRGYTHVEIDARITADGHVVCFHNDALMEEAGVDGRISEMSRDALTQVVLTRSGEGIPTFEAYCARCAGRIGVMVDLKGCRDELIVPYADEIQAALREHGLLEDAMILIDKTPRDNQDLIARRFEDKVRVSWREPLAQTQEAARRDPKLAERHYVLNHGEDFTREDVAGYQALGLRVIVSVNRYHYPEGDPMAFGIQHIEQLMEYGVDGFVIDSCYDPAFRGSA
jgi:glycerophosphoryl diester phosphodiesterase